MSLFSSVLGGTVSNVVSGAVRVGTSYAISAAGEKVKEATTQIANVLGINSSFEKIGSALPTVSELTSMAFRAGTSELTSNPFVRQQMELMAQSTGLDISAQNVNAAAGKTPDSTDHIVRLTDAQGRVLPFIVMPEIVESRAVSYDAVAPVQGPGAFQKFRGTESTQWTLNATFIARNSREATENMDFINMLRAWSMPYFGDNSAQGANRQMLGAPPAVLTLSGLRSRIIGPVPVVITSLNWNWPRDVDYLPTEQEDEKTGQFVPFPAVMTVAIQLVESYSTAQFNKFNIEEFRKGNFVTAFDQSITS